MAMQGKFEKANEVLLTAPGYGSVRVRREKTPKLAEGDKQIFLKFLRSENISSA